MDNWVKQRSIEEYSPYVEEGDYTYWGFIFGDCSSCKRKHVLCEVLINSKGDKVNVCEKCEAGKEEQEG